MPREDLIVVHSADELERYRPAWRELASEAIERNPFYEPCALLPAWRHLATPAERVVLVFDSMNPGPQGRLLGLFPLEDRSVYRHVPLYHLACWDHDHCFLGTPLVRRGYVERCLSRLLSWFDGAEQSPRLLDFDGVSADGPFFAVLQRTLTRQRRTHDLHYVYQRSALALSGFASGAAYRRQVLSKRRRKRLRHGENRLRALGDLETVMLERSDDLQRWIDDFLSLEGRGWKGQRGSALVAHESDRAFFTELVEQAFYDDQLLMLALTLDGQPLAMQVNLLAGDAGFALKVAFDEAHARHSPGILLELAAIDLLLRRGGPVSWLDSCVAPGPSYIDSLWNSRRMLASCVVSSRRLSDKLLLRGTRVAAGLRSRSKDLWREIRTAGV